MTTFLLLLSLFLNIIALFAIIILFLRQNRLLQVERKQEKMITEMEEVISTYLVQMKEENESFINRVKRIDPQPIDHSFEKRNKAVDSMDFPIENNLQKQVGKAAAYKAASLYKKNVMIHEKDIDIPLNKEGDSVELPSLEENSLINQILQLKKQGLNIGEIAQKLNKGKTEVELLLKFHKN